MPPPGAPPDRDKGILREWRIIEALDGTEVPHTAAVGVCPDASVLGRPFYLMGFVDGWSPMDLDEQAVAGAVRHRPRRAPGPGLPTRRRHRVAVEGGLEGQGAAGPRPARRLSRTSSRPVDRLLRADQGPRDRRSGRGHRMAAHPPAARLHPRPDARRLPVRQCDVPQRRTGAARRDRRLGDGHGRRPEAGSRVDGAELAGEHRCAGAVGDELRRHARNAFSRQRWSSTTRKCPGGRSTISTTTWCWPSGSSRSCWSRVSSARATTRSCWPTDR